MDKFSALSEPSRRKIIELLADRGPLSARDICDQFQVSPSAISQHLKILHQAGLVQVEKRAQQRIYRIEPGAMSEVEDWAKRMSCLWRQRFETLEALLEVEAREESNNSAATFISGYAQLNEINLYYEIHGHGSPLVLLHGGLGTITMFNDALPALAQTHQVIAVELRGHGHTELGDAPLSFEGMADDVFALIQHLGLSQVDLCGYSLGGGAALQAAIRHSQVVRKLVIVSAACKQSGWYPEVLAGMAAMNAEAAHALVGSPMQQAYASVAPKPENWPLLVDRVGALLRQDYDWSQDVAALKVPTLIVVGDADSVRPAHAVEFFQLLGGGQRDAGWDGSGMPNSRLAILPATTHYNSFASPALPPMVKQFLDAPMP